MPIWEIINGYTRYWLVVAALDLGVFELLAGGPQDAAKLAEATGVDAARLEIVLDHLVAVGLLAPLDDGGCRRWDLTDPARDFLLRDAPMSMTNLVRFSPGTTTVWPELSATLRRGRPTRSVEDDEGLFYSRLATATAPMGMAVAGVAAAALPDPGPDALVLDLGAGAAPWAVAMLQAWPQARGIAVELPSIAPITRAAAAAHGLADRLEVIAGSYLDAVLPIGEAAVVTLGQVLGLQSPDLSKALLLRARGALRPGGFVVIGDYLRSQTRPTGRDPIATVTLSMALTWIANTAQAEVLTMSTLRSWLTEVGLVIWATMEPLPGQWVVIATEPA